MGQPGLLLPALIFLIVLTQIPFLVTIVSPRLKWNLLYPARPGLHRSGQLQDALTSGDLWPSIVATVLITAFAVVLSLLFGLGFAVLLDRKFRGRAIARTLMITPFLVMPAAAALIWKYSMFDTNIGMVNWLLPHARAAGGLLGHRPPDGHRRHRADLAVHARS